LEVEIRRTSCGLFDNASAEFVESECDRLVGLFAVVLGFTEVWGRVDTLRVAEKRKKVFLFTVSDGPLVVFWLEFGNFFFFFALRLFLNFFFSMRLPSSSYFFSFSAGASGSGNSSHFSFVSSAEWFSSLLKVSETIAVTSPRVFSMRKNSSMKRSVSCSAGSANLFELHRPSRRMNRW